MEKKPVKKALDMMAEGKAAELLKKLRGKNKTVLGENKEMAEKDTKNPSNYDQINDSQRTSPSRPSSTSPERAAAEKKTSEVADSISKKMAEQAIQRMKNRKK